MSESIKTEWITMTTEIVRADLEYAQKRLDIAKKYGNKDQIEYWQKELDCNIRFSAELCIKRCTAT